MLQFRENVETASSSTQKTILNRVGDEFAMNLPSRSIPRRTPHARDTLNKSSGKYDAFPRVVESVPGDRLSDWRRHLASVLRLSNEAVAAWHPSADRYVGRGAAGRGAIGRDAARRQFLPGLG